MSMTAIYGSSTTGLLHGTLPLRPFHPDGFVGTMQADGQQVRVAALACDETRVVALSLVGFDTSIGVVFSRLWSSTAVPFTPADNWQDEWRGLEQLARSGERYKQCVAHLEGTREVHALALVRTAHLTEGILHPPDLPEMQKPSDAPEQEQEQAPARSLPAAKQSRPPVWVPRYVLGNWDEAGPNRQSFLGHLYALRVLFLHRHAEHPEWPIEWADALWQRGLASELITPFQPSACAPGGSLATYWPGARWSARVCTMAGCPGRNRSRSSESKTLIPHLQSKAVFDASIVSRDQGLPCSLSVVLPSPSPKGDSIIHATRNLSEFSHLGLCAHATATCRADRALPAVIPGR